MGKTTVVSKSKFKPHALKYFRYVEETGEEIVITDHANPVAKIIPYREDSENFLLELRNSVIKYDDPMEPVGLEDWKALK